MKAVHIIITIGCIFGKGLRIVEITIMIIFKIKILKLARGVGEPSKFRLRGFKSQSLIDCIGMAER
jgi:hypothetical protein